MMNAVPADQRGAAGGMIATFQNSAFVLSIGIFFTLMVAGLSSKLPAALSSGLTAQGVPAAAARSRSRTCRRSACCSPRSSATTRSSSCSARCSLTCPPATRPT